MLPIHLVVVFILSQFTLKKIFFYNDYFLIFYPFRFFKRKKKYRYSDIKKLKFSAGSRLGHGFEFKIYRLFFRVSFYLTYDAHYSPVLLKKFKRKKVFIKFFITDNYKKMKKEIERYDPEKDDPILF